jgi:hypothetical protein
MKSAAPAGRPLRVAERITRKSDSAGIAIPGDALTHGQDAKTLFTAARK